LETAGVVLEQRRLPFRFDRFDRLDAIVCLDVTFKPKPDGA
jgi:hypothetical protein